jgi:hypothetical protein
MAFALKSAVSGKAGVAKVSQICLSDQVSSKCGFDHLYSVTHSSPFWCSGGVSSPSHRSCQRVQASMETRQHTTSLPEGRVSIFEPEQRVASLVNCGPAVVQLRHTRQCTFRQHISTAIDKQTWPARASRLDLSACINAQLLSTYLAASIT